MNLKAHLASLPDEVAIALTDSYQSVVDHFFLEEWDDAQVDAGRLCEAVLRYLQVRMGKKYTPIDGKSKPNRKSVVASAVQDTELPPSLRAQVPQGVEMILDFRNNRNAAHLGDLDANRIDASCVLQIASWVMAEIIRLETSEDEASIQIILDQFADRPIPTVQTINGWPIVLQSAELSAADKALVLLLHSGPENPVSVSTLRKWAGYGNASRWRTQILKALEKRTFIHVDADQDVHLLRPGQREAESIILRQRGVAT